MLLPVLPEPVPRCHLLPVPADLQELPVLPLPVLRCRLLPVDLQELPVLPLPVLRCRLLPVDLQELPVLPLPPDLLPLLLNSLPPAVRFSDLQEPSEPLLPLDPLPLALQKPLLPLPKAFPSLRVEKAVPN